MYNRKKFDSQLMEDAIHTAEVCREALHRMPEAAFDEMATTEYIRRACKDCPVELIDLGMETGLVYYLDLGCADTVALRADIDAVPTESGYLHLCGHDAHAAALIGAMHYLCGYFKDKDRESAALHNVLFIFQPAEEGTRGARAMLDHGLLEKVPQRPLRIFGIHNRPEAVCGDVIVHEGPLMSEKSVFKITLTGRAGHGSTPQKCIDPVVAAASLVLGIHSVISRNVDPMEPALCTVSGISAGMSESAAPETAVINGYIRSFDHETHERMCARVRGLAEGTAAAYECRCDIETDHLVPAVCNSKDMYEIALRAAETAVGKEHITDSAPCLASEDFAVFGSVMPSFFYWAGSGTEGVKNAPWHDPAFRMDPDYMKTAVPLLCASCIAV